MTTGAHSPEPVETLSPAAMTGLRRIYAEGRVIKKRLGTLAGPVFDTAAGAWADRQDGRG